MGSHGEPVAWRGRWWYPDKGGYLVCHRTFMHREVYETHIGPIPEGYHVHHINRERSDNRPKNLMAMDPDDHKRLPQRRKPGHVRKRGDTWQVIVELEPDPLTGRRRAISRTAKTAKAAEKLRAKLVTEAADGTAQQPEKRTVSDLASAWLAHIEPSRSPSTMIGYRNKIDRYVTPTIGKVRLDRLKAIQLDGLYSTLRASGGEDGKALSAQTVRHVHAILHAMLVQARRWGWIVRNPAEDATPPAPESVEPIAPTPEQVAALYEGAGKDYDLALAVWIGAVGGPRRGEVCALRWSDLDGGMLNISRALVVAGHGELRVKSTKTRKVRRVTLDPYTVSLIAEHRARYEERASACGVEIAADGYLISEAPTCCDPIHPDVLSKRFQRLAERLGLDCHLHQLRHFHDTYLLAAGVPVRIIAGRAGHDARQVLTRYGHFIDQSDAAAAEVLSNAVRPDR